MTIYSLPNQSLADGSVERDIDNVILAFCGHCGNGTLVLNPDEWFASRRRVTKKSSNRGYIGRTCTYCFAAGLRPDRSEYDELVEKGK